MLAWDGYDANASYYEVSLKMVCGGVGEDVRTLVSVGLSELTVQGGIVSFDASDLISSVYGDRGYSGETVEVSCTLSAKPPLSSGYRPSSESQPSNAIYYHPAGSTHINAVVLSPPHPVVSVGRGIYVGQTIMPEDAHYSEVRWSSSDTSVFKVSNAGLVTGVASGNASLTAKINNASVTISVSVYELVTNIEDEGDAATVEDAANDAIEGIVGSGDTSGTDLDGTDVDSAAGDIKNAAQEGDQFSAGLTVEPIGQDELSVPWKDVWEYTRGWHFGSASGVRIALGYTQKNGKFHLVCNLTSLDGPVGFELPAPEDLPPVPAGKNREYKLVTIHGKEIKELPYTYRDGRFYAASSEFSEFVLVYQDTDCEHIWANSAFSWSENGKTCFVTYACAKDPSHTRTEACEVTSMQKTAATCSAKGVTTYAAKYGSDTSTKDVADIPIDPTAHSWGEPTYAWSDDSGKCTANRMCKNDRSHSESEVSTAVRKVTKEPTEEADGSATYTVAFKSVAFSTQARTVAITEACGRDLCRLVRCQRWDGLHGQAGWRG